MVVHEDLLAKSVCPGRGTRSSVASSQGLFVHLGQHRTNKVGYLGVRVISETMLHNREGVHETGAVFLFPQAQEVHEPLRRHFAVNLANIKVTR